VRCLRGVCTRGRPRRNAREAWTTQATAANCLCHSLVNLARISMYTKPSNPTLVFYSCILQGIASRFQNSASKREVAPRKRVAIPIRSHLHACCQVETHRDATLVEMCREVHPVCDRSAGNCHINPPETCDLVCNVATQAKQKAS
jgi:hypothetical protein